VSKNVFANGREVSGKKDDNKAICSMPDVCLSPPSPPAGPLPIPYPNTSQASDTSDGSKSVKIGGDEVGLKNASTYKKSTGDEAATKSFGMNVVSHNIQGPLKHAAWSMDVQIEGQNAIRHMDMTTQNHSNPGGLPGIDIASMKKPGGDPECVELEKKSREAVKSDAPNGRLPKNDALVLAKTSRGRTFKAVQPGTDWTRSSKSNGYSQPHGEKNHPCKGKRHSTNRQGNKNHSECKIMHDAVAGGLGSGGSITMRVNWNTSGKLSDSPCGQCMGSICETAAKCGIDIFICEGDADKMEKKKAPCKSTTHRPGTDAYKKRGPVSHKWVGSAW
jgi:Domain of unknown function (DUF4150)